MAEQEKDKATGVLDDATNTSNPTDVNSTYQTTTVNDTGDTVIKDAYANKDKSGYASTPNTTTDAVDSKTGSGLKAAEGTNYSWETKAEERAKLDYESSVLETKSNMLQNRQDLESKGQQFQDQFAMQQYKQNQSIDKVGWTGGYVLDSERQVNYLKQTIQAQMYGQMELQKYGYDTSLAAARLAYDTNRYDLALEYYNTALSRAVSEAEITGYYVSPETNEMLDQYSIASQTLNDPNAKEDEKLRADKILASVYNWFEGHGISKQGVETYNHIIQERTNKMSIEQTLDYINKANKQIDSNTFTKLDANGNAIVGKDGTTVETINFNTVSKEDLLDYIGSSETAKQQYYGYLDTKITGETETQFKTWLISKGLMNKQEDGSYTPKSNTDYASHLYQFLKSSDIYQSLMDSFKDISDEKAKNLQDIYENWDFEIALPDGTSILRTFKELQNEVIDMKNTSGDTKLSDVTEKNEDGTYKNTYSFNKKSISFDGQTSETVKVNDDLIFWSVQADLGNKAYNSEADFKLSNGIGDNYNLELATSHNETLKGINLEELQETYKRVYGQDMPANTTFVYKGELYVFNRYTQYETVGGTSKPITHENIYRAKGQCKNKAGSKGNYTDLIKRIQENA